MDEQPRRILLVDDDDAVARLTARVLERAGFHVHVVASAAEALESISLAEPDLLLLDFDLPDLTATEVLAELQRAHGSLSFPVVILTGARTAASDQVLGLERGAADYVLKGVDRDVLVARIRRALRDKPPESDRVVRGRLTVDLRESRAVLGERQLALERKPLTLLYQLAVHEPKVVTRDELLRSVWGTDYHGFEHSVEQAVYELRRALGAEWIETVPRSGYRLRVQ